MSKRLRRRQLALPARSKYRCKPESEDMTVVSDSSAKF